METIWVHFTRKCNLYYCSHGKMSHKLDAYRNAIHILIQVVCSTVFYTDIIHVEQNGSHHCGVTIHNKFSSGPIGKINYPPQA